MKQIYCRVDGSMETGSLQVAFLCRKHPTTNYALNIARWIQTQWHHLRIVETFTRCSKIMTSCRLRFVEYRSWWIQLVGCPFGSHVWYKSKPILNFVQLLLISNVKKKSKKMFLTIKCVLCFCTKFFRNVFFPDKYFGDVPSITPNKCHLLCLCRFLF